MLELKNVTKVYRTGSQSVTALDGMSLGFRKSEFVSILGPSGCGKTTLLNLIGSLDSPTSGDILLDGRSVQGMSEREKDAFRNHAVGFVFQSYNLIPHQTILSNVELALTLNGVSPSERRKRALDALEEVGLREQAHKRPLQLSGGQMQRVAIARALVNDPQILLADEPTGALDSETGLQVMELLAQVAKTRLVIMVTHNPELARDYSTRVIRLLDGRLAEDSDPLPEAKAQDAPLDIPRTSMGFFTALKLSLSNLLTKKTRTLLVAFAGSIGIIGIALILALSTGVQNYIDTVERDALTSYPLTLTRENMDVAGIVTSLTGAGSSTEKREEDTAGSTPVMRLLLSSLFTGAHQNDLRAFKEHIESDPEFAKLGLSVTYGYPLKLYLWRSDLPTPLQVHPSTVMDDMAAAAAQDERTQFIASMGLMNSDKLMAADAFGELADDPDILKERYVLTAGRFPEARDELLLILDSNGNLSDYVLYTLGLRDRAELQELLLSVLTRQENTAQSEPSYSYEELLDLSFRLVLPSDLYAGSGTNWDKITVGSEEFGKMLDSAPVLRITGIALASADGISGSTGMIGYLPSLSAFVMEAIDSSEVVRCQRENPETDVIKNMPFGEREFDIDDVDLGEYTGIAQSVGFMLGGDRLNEIIRSVVPTYGSNATYEGNMDKFGVCDPDDPSSISIYAPSFEAKQALIDYIDRYNEAALTETATISYTDYIALLLGGVTDIVDAITYVLVAFVAVSLIVSSIMIGVITYISVMERTKEIGILRALGASRRDISRVFNAETLLVGFAAGVLGVALSALLIIPINSIIASTAGVKNLARLPAASSAILVGISMLLTLIAGLIPSRVASHRDPVVALRNE